MERSRNCRIPSHSRLLAARAAPHPRLPRTLRAGEEARFRPAYPRRQSGQIGRQAAVRRVRWACQAAWWRGDGVVASAPGVVHEASARLAHGSRGRGSCRCFASRTPPWASEVADDARRRLRARSCPEPSTICAPRLRWGRGLLKKCRSHGSLPAGRSRRAACSFAFLPTPRRLPSGELASSRGAGDRWDPPVHCVGFDRSW